MNNSDLLLCVLTFADVFEFVKVFGSVEVRSFSPQNQVPLIIFSFTDSMQKQRPRRKKRERKRVKNGKENRKKICRGRER